MMLLVWTLTHALALEPGPYTVGARDIVFDDPQQGRIWARVHYPATRAGDDAPADPSGGPYPVAAFLHGWLGSAWMYTESCDHLASLGLVVINMDTETHPFLDYDTFARDTIATLEWVEDKGGRPSHWLAGMPDAGSWTAMGHSMGGATLARLTDLEPRIRTLVGFMPYESDSADDYVAMRVFDGSALYLVGTHDDTSTPPIVTRWFTHMDATQRGLFFNLQGAGHQAISNFEAGAEPMDDVAQREAVLTLASDFLAAEVFGDPVGHAELLFDAPSPMARAASRSQAPAIVLEATGTLQARMGVLGPADATVVLYAGTGPGQTDTADHGAVGLADAQVVQAGPLADGRATLDLSLDTTWASSWFQVVVVDGDRVTLGAPTDLWGVGLPAPDTPDDPATEPDDAEGPGTHTPGAPDAPGALDEDLALAGACGGCDQSGRAPWGVLVLAGLALRRRR